MAHGETILPELMALIEDRKTRRPPRSYTTTLLDGGIETIGAKVREEANELIAAARATSDRPTSDHRKAVVHEAADLLYHLLVLLAACDVRLGEVETELARRQGVSGLDEKASR